MKIFFSVGEPSGDLHGANLIAGLRRHDDALRCLGFGGPRMAAAGCELLEDLTQLAVMGFSRVVRQLGTFRRLLKAAGELLDRDRPDAVVLIDYPGFNWWVARLAKRRGIPVFYYGVPQMWAWAPWRVRKMRRLVDHVLCKLPFEVRWFEQRGCRATYVGHPYFDELAARELDADVLAREAADARPLVTILPGSRNQEVTDQLPWLLKAAERIASRRSDVRFAIGAFNRRQATMAEEMVKASGLELPVYVGQTGELIESAHCCLACSGSVSLELLYHARPTVILYWMRRLPFLFGWYVLVTARYVTLVNLLAVEQPFGRGHPPDPDRPGAESTPFPEYPTYQDKSREIAQHALRWLSDEADYASRVAWLRQLKQQYAQAGASHRAAAYIASHLLEHSPRESASPRSRHAA